jgi:hypothetical protein
MLFFKSNRCGSLVAQIHMIDTPKYLKVAPCNHVYKTQPLLRGYVANKPTTRVGQMDVSAFLPQAAPHFHQDHTQAV